MSRYRQASASKDELSRLLGMVIPASPPPSTSLRRLSTTLYSGLSTGGMGLARSSYLNLLHFIHLTADQLRSCWYT